MESIAALHTLLSPLVFLAGSDSQSYLCTHKKLLARQNKHFSKPWGIVHDGDVWALYEQLLTYRGCNTSDFVKVKGHAKQVDIDKGRSTLEQQHGNDTVDSGATEAYKLFENSGLAIANTCAHRQNHYANWLGLWLRFLVHNCMEDKRLRDVHEKRVNPESKEPTCLSCLCLHC
jgi:hypothetical protein